MDKKEFILRRDLSAAHWLTHHYNLDDLVWNHISARFKNGYLITPGNSMWDNIQPKNVLFSSENETADLIHSAVYDSRSDVQALVHIHSPSVRAVSCLENGVMFLDQNSSQMYGKISYHDWEGISDDKNEKEKIAKNFGQEAHTLMMYNHGACCTGNSVGQAWIRAWYLEKICETQLSVMQSGGKIKFPPKEILQHSAMQVETKFPAGKYEWNALLAYWQRHANVQNIGRQKIKRAMMSLKRARI